ncbi:hypothetical protein JKP88DRAFT_283448 [Tribonema minus]|uniref:Uncharacterized protein n=1 Tax=Tribonema minus TaxID=303371 RepID=A0A836C736_9STRA|nr:hypothetical protein JKP88DRAFT_283448 [Tribonema minus]
MPAPFEAFFWESAPICGKTAASAPFEFVVVGSPALAGIRADPRPFWEHIGPEHGSQAVETFLNLGRDALLVSPCKAADTNAPSALRCNFNSSRVSLIWLSTAGMGVHWLHARIDLTPKYYTYTPYKSWPQ